MAKARLNETVRVFGVVRRNRPALMTSTALQATAMLVLVFPAYAQPLPNAHPTGWSVVAGAAAISQTTSTTQINQSSQRAAIDWKSFDVGSQQSVTFSQPSASAVALNRVTGPDPSQIAGRIDANGQIILLNQSGVNFYKGAQVNAAGVMVSTIGASDQSVKSFVASTSGRLALDQPGNPNAKVDNAGNITIKQAGLAALVAPQVANSGTITATLGHVVLAGAKTATLDLYGDGLLSLDVTNQVTQAPIGKDGKPATALVTNTGVIVADGGTVQLTARAADGIVQNLVQAGGTIRAATAGGQTGTVALNGVGGSIVVEGQLAAPGTAPGTSGGSIVANVTGTVTLTSGAMLNASGRAGGGTVAVGTTLARAKGGPGVTPMLTAANVVVQKGATIAADATDKGQGGRVTTLSTNATAMAGSISAKGGPQGGDGGTVETSGNALTLGQSAVVDTRAPQGLTGTWLRDPTNWTIAQSGGNETPAEVVTALKTSNVTTTANNDITVSDPINARSDPAAANSLIFRAGRNILVNASITLNGGGFTATANDSADLGTNLPDRSAGTGAFTLAGGVTIDTSVSSKSISIAVGPFAVNTGFVSPPEPPISPSISTAVGPSVVFGGDFEPGRITLVNLTTGGGAITARGGIGLGLSGYVNAGAGTVTLTPAGAIIQTAGSITAGTLVGTAVASATLTSATNAIGILGAFAVTGGNFLLTNATPLSVTGAVGAAVVDLTASSIVLSGPITATSSLGLTAANGAITEETGGSIVTHLFRASTAGTGGDISLPNTANKIDLSNGIAATNGNVVLVNGQDLALVGTFSGNNLFFEVAPKGGTLTLSDSDPQSDSPNSANLTAIGGRISLVADNYAIEPNFDTKLVDARITAGTLELAPISSINTSLLGNTGLVVDATMLSIIQTGGGTLDVGGYTHVLTGATTPAASASFVTIDNVLNLTTIASTLRLDATGTITQVPGAALTVGTLVGSAVTIADLSTNPNAVDALGSLTVSGGPFALNDGGSAGNLAVNGPVTATTVTIQNAPTISIIGSVGAGKQAVVASGAGGIVVGAGGIISSPTIDLNGAAGGIALSGKASVGQTGGLVDLTTTGGGVTEASTATVTAGTLQSIAGIDGNVALAGGSNAIANIGSLTVRGGTFSLTDTGNLNVAGNLTASDITIGDVGKLTVLNNLIATGTANLAATNNIAIPGSVNGGSVTLSSTTGSISETGSLIAGTLRGSAIDTASLAGVNRVGALGNFSAGSFTLNDSTDLLIQGTLNAARIAIPSPSSRISLGDGAAIITGGTARRPGPIQPALEPANGGPGALLEAASFVQIGSSTVLGQGGGPATVQISTTGNVQFDPPLGLAATGTWLILNLTNGSAAGNVFVNALDVTYTAPGSTNLTGTIAGIAGGPAAAVGTIEPAVNNAYLFNSCVIGAAVCTNTPVTPVTPVTVTPLNVGLTATLGAIEPLVTLPPPALTALPGLAIVTLPMLQVRPPQLTDPDVVPPNITYMDY